MTRRTQREPTRIQKATAAAWHSGITSPTALARAAACSVGAAAARIDSAMRAGLIPDPRQAPRGPISRDHLGVSAKRRQQLIDEMRTHHRSKEAP